MAKKFTDEEIEKTKKDIQEMSHFAMAHLWRFAPAGHPYFDKTLPFYEIFEKQKTFYEK